MREHDIFAEPGVVNNPELVDAVDRIFSFGRLLEKLIAQTPAALVGPTGMNTVENNLQPVLNELTALTSSRNIGHLVNAASYIDNVQPYLWAFPPTSLPSGASLLPELMAEQASTAQHAIAMLVTSRDEALGRMEVLKVEIEGLSNQLKDLAEGAARERAEAATTVAKLETAFAKEQLERNAANAASLELLEAGFKTAVNTAKDESTKLLKDLSDKKDQAAQIVQVVGNIGVTGNYQQISAAEARQANVWRGITVAIFAVGIGVAVATFCRYWGEPVSGVNAASIAVRLLYAIAITAPAWYTAKESARHRTNADRAKQTELELASIGPFIELMPDDKKFAIREELTKRYFGNEVEEHTSEPPVKFADVKDLLVESIKAVRK
jgi:hypothetical protein